MHKNANNARNEPENWVLINQGERDGVIGSPPLVLTNGRLRLCGLEAETRRGLSMEDRHSSGTRRQVAETRNATTETSNK